MKAYKKISLLLIALAVVISMCTILSGCASSAEMSDEEMAAIAFTKIFAILPIVVWGIVIPIAPMVIGIVFANSKHHKKHSYWYVISVLSLAAMLTSLITIVIILAA